MKKTACLSIIVLLMLNASSFALAKENNKDIKEVTYYTEEITDLDLLLEMGKNGVTDKVNKGSIKLEKNMNGIISSNLNSSSSTIVTDLGIDIEHYSTTQKLKIFMNYEGIKVTEYVTTDIILMRSSGGSDYEYEYDGSYSVKAYSTVYWTENSSGDTLITRTTGGWNVLDSQVRISNRHVKIGCSGLNPTSLYVTQIMDEFPLSSFDYITDSNWIHVTISDFSAIGVTTWCNITRGTESWTFEFSHTL